MLFFTAPPKSLTSWFPLSLSPLLINQRNYSHLTKSTAQPHDPDRQVPFRSPLRYDSDDGWYWGLWVAAGIGEPAQPVEFCVVSNKYITVPYSGICQSNPEACKYGSYNPTKSTSQQIVGNGAFSNGRFDELYNNEGDMFQDQLELGGVTVTNLTAGLEEHGSLPTLNLGLLMDYPDGPLTLSTAMADEKVISTSAYSLAVDRKAGSAHGNGTLIFGAVDSKKFVGDLVRLEASDFGFGKRRSTVMGVALTSLKVGSPTGEDELLAPEAPLFVNFAPSNEMVVLPSKVCDLIFAEIGDVDNGPENDDDGNPTVACARANPDAYLSFQFHGPSGPAIRAPLADFFVPFNYTPGLPRKGPGYDPRRHGERCKLRIRYNLRRGFSAPVTNWDLELGEPMLRNAYVVFDLENHHLALAQASYSAESELVPFASRGAYIPLSTPGPVVRPSVRYNLSNATFSDLRVAKFDRLLAAPGIQTPFLSQASSQTKSLAIGLGVGLPLGLVAVVAGAAVLWAVKLGGHIRSSADGSRNHLQRTGQSSRAGGRGMDAHRRHRLRSPPDQFPPPSLTPTLQQNRARPLRCKGPPPYRRLQREPHGSRTAEGLSDHKIR
ncbi:hypothetical protein PG984_008484 [Apiospora sp. TS-2023a]